jgi:hypothetical protein
MNGQVIQSLRGEWLKLYSYMTHDANKRQVINQMVEEIYLNSMTLVMGMVRI